MPQADLYFRDLESAQWRDCERLVRRFEEAHRRGEGPAFEDYLPSDGPLRKAALVELVHTDLELRREAGEDVLVDSYLARFPELADDGEAAQTLIAAEFSLRRRRQPDLGVQEYQQRFPHLGDGLISYLMRKLQEESTMPPSSLSGVVLGGVLPRVPGYEVQEEIGRGGMGVVYRARQRWLNRDVALKMILSGSHAGPEERVRFLAEAELAAAVRHPGIVQVYEMGTHEGLAYFALELCPGGSLQDVLQGTPRPATEAARLVERVARAVQAAHGCGVVHRDLKPANVLLDGHGEPKVADFGLALRVEAGSGLTGTGVVIGTPSYMPPEQAQGQKDVGPAADVYSLGAILYEMLTGRPPFRGASRLETLQAVVSVDPVPPRRLQPGVPADLDTICLRCLHKEPVRRYASAGELADDLLRFLEGRPILARPVSAVERLARWGRRHPSRAAAALAGVVALAVTAALVVGMYYHQQLQGAFNQTRQALAAEEDHRRAAEAAEGRAQDALGHARAFDYFRHVLLADSARRDHQTQRAVTLLGECHEPSRQWEWRYLHRQCHMDRLALRGHRGRVSSLAIDAAGARLASGGQDGTIRLWTMPGGEAGRVFIAGPGAVQSLTFSPCGRWLVSAVGRRLKVWDVTGDTPSRVLGELGTPVTSLAISPDGRWLVVSSGIGTTPEAETAVTVWDFPGPASSVASRPRLALPGHAFGSRVVTFSPDGRRLVSSDFRGLIRLWDFEGWSGDKPPRVEVLRGHQKAVATLAFSADGSRLASASLDGKVIVWDFATRRQALTLSHPAPAALPAVAFDREGGHLFCVGFDDVVRVWDLAGGQSRPDLLGHTDIVTHAIAGPQGELTTASLDGTVRFWGPLRPDRGLVVRHARELNSLDLHPTGRVLAVAPMDSRVSFWDIERGQQLATLPLPGYAHKVCFSREGRRLAVASKDGIRLWNLDDSNRPSGEPTFLPRAGVTDIAFHPDGRTLASSDADRLLCFWNLADGRLERSFGRESSAWSCLALSPDGRLLASGGDNFVAVWDAATGRRLHQLMGVHQNTVIQLTFSADGQRLASASADRTVALWVPTTGVNLRVLRGHRSGVSTVAFSPDGQRLASAGSEGTIRLWELERGLEALLLQGHSGGVRSLRFHPDGHRLYSVATDGELRLWDASP